MACTDHSATHAVVVLPRLDATVGEARSGTSRGLR